MIKQLITLGLLLAVGCTPTSKPLDLDYEKAHAAVTLAAFTSNLISDEDPIEPDTPVSDVCENCDGTGKLGDGRVFVDCPVCDGTGKRTNKTATSVVVQKSAIVIYTRPFCPPCKKWKQVEKPKLEAKGWVVQEKPAGAGASPYFDIMLPKKKTIRHNGYLTMDQLRSYMGLRVTQYKPDSYIPRWQNNDGLSFEEHARVYHGINTAGLSRDQIAQMRDADHDKFGPYHPAAMRFGR